MRCERLQLFIYCGLTLGLFRSVYSCIYVCLAFGPDDTDFLPFLFESGDLINLREFCTPPTAGNRPVRGQFFGHEFTCPVHHLEFHQKRKQWIIACLKGHSSYLQVAFPRKDEQVPPFLQ